MFTTVQLGDPFGNKMQSNTFPSYNLEKKINQIMRYKFIIPRKKDIVELVTMVFVRRFWSERNDRLFQGIEMPTHIRRHLITHDCYNVIKNIKFKNEDERNSELILGRFNKCEVYCLWLPNCHSFMLVVFSLTIFII